MKKILIYILSIIFILISMVGCAGDNMDDKPIDKLDTTFKGEPTYSEKKQMFISAYWGPNPNIKVNGVINDAKSLEQFQWAKDAGFTHVYLEKKYGEAGTESWSRSLNFAEQVGLKTIAQRDDYKKPFTSDPVDYSLYPSFAGHNIWDEPSALDYDMIARDYDLFEAKYGETDAVFYQNLFPNLASEAQMGVSNYERYVDLYGKKVLSKIKKNRTISCDSYPLRRSTSGDYLRSGHLPTLDTIARAAVKYKAEPYFFIQTMDFGKGNRAPTKQDFDMQVYTCFAFGMKGIQHFTYNTPGETPQGPNGEFDFGADGKEQTGLIDRKFQKTERWEYAQSINAEIQKFAEVYLNFNWRGVMTANGTNADPDLENEFAALKSKIVDDKRVKSFTSTEDTIMGCFKDAKGYDGYMITPYITATANKTTTVNAEFTSATKAIIIANGEKSIVELNGGKLKLEIPSGEGIFVIPYYI